MIHPHPCARCGRLTAPRYSLCAYCWERLQRSGDGANGNPYAPIVEPLPVKLLCWGRRYDEHTLILQPGDPVTATDVLPKMGMVFLLHVPTGLKLWAEMRHWKAATGQTREARR